MNIIIAVAVIGSAFSLGILICLLVALSKGEAPSFHVAGVRSFRAYRPHRKNK